MTSSTPNLALTLYNSTTDQSETFANFRAVLAGPATSSNFYKIDTAIGVNTTDITALKLTRGAIRVPALFVSANYYEANSITDITSITTNMSIILSLDTTSNGTVTLNINALGVKSLMKINTAGTPVNITAGELVVGKFYLFTYDGTRWIWVNSTVADQIHIEGTSGNVVTVNSDNTLLGTTSQSLLMSNTLHAATNKTTPVDADEFDIWNSVGALLGKVTWANVKATLKTYFDGYYTNAFPAMFKNGLTLSNNTTDNVNDIDIASGACRDIGNTINMVLSSALTKRLDATWTVGTNQGGLDTGTIANTTYHVWLIRRSDTGVVDVLFSTSASSPTMPTSYDSKRRIGSILRESSAIVEFIHNVYTNTFIRKNEILSSSVSNQDTNAASITLHVPIGIAVEAIIILNEYDTTCTSTAFWLVTDLAQTDNVPSATAKTVNTSVIVSGSPAYIFMPLRIMTNTSAQVRSRVSLQISDLFLEFYTHGWVDTSL